VGHVDLAATFAEIAGVEPPPGNEGVPLPTAAGSDRSHVLTTFDSQFAKVGMHLRTIWKDGWLCTAYEPSTTDRGGAFPLYSSIWLRGSEIPRYGGTEGELYDTREDPHQLDNRWDDRALRKLRTELVDELRAALPRERDPLPVDAPT